MATKRSKKVVNDEEDNAGSPYDPMELFGQLEKVVGIQSVTLSDESRLSTGLLCADLLLGRGGLTAGQYGFAGPEQSAKTTLAITILANSINQDVGMRVLWDAENSSGSSQDYVENIFRAAGVKVAPGSIFGVKDGGSYQVKPMVYYRDEGQMETFFDWTAAMLRRLPDKRFSDGKWWFVYENTKENKAKYGGQADRTMSSQNGAIYIPAKNGSLQAVILVDSWPALLPKALDADDPKAGMAIQARGFSQNVPRIKGYLRSKRVAIIGINQLRQKIGFVLGNPYMEPMGEALKYFSDVRIWLTPRSLSGVPFNPKGKGQIETEPSVDGSGEDTYRYVHVKTIKNKLSVPGLETWLRIWVSNSKGQAQGFCPVWDTFYALSQTGQLSGKRSSMILNVASLGEAKKAINWMEFKTLILGDKESRLKIFEKIGYRPVNLRAGLFSMSRKGTLQEKLIDNLNASTKTKDADDDSDSEDDDE